MSYSPTPYIIAVAITAGAALIAQSAPDKSLTTEINERLSSAKANAQAEEAQLQKEATIRAASDLPQQAARALADRNNPEKLAEEEKLRDAQARLDSALATASPEGRMLLAQNKATAPGGTDAPPEIIPPGSAKPVPLKPTPIEEEKKKGPKQAIINAETNYFDPSNSISIFEGNVTANHPDFDITCEKLEIHMKKTEKKATPKPTAPTSANVVEDPKPTTTPATAEPESAPAEGQSGIEKAIATGPLVTIKQHAPDGTDKIGKGRHVTYDGKTGDITLRGMPQVQDGFNMIIATSPETVLVITAAGQIRTFGPHQTKLVQEGGSPSKPKSSAPSTKAAATAPATGPSVAPTRTVIQPPTKKGR